MEIQRLTLLISGPVEETPEFMLTIASESAEVDLDLEDDRWPVSAQLRAEHWELRWPELELQYVEGQLVITIPPSCHRSWESTTRWRGPAVAYLIEMMGRLGDHQTTGLADSPTDWPSPPRGLQFQIDSDRY